VVNTRLGEEDGSLLERVQRGDDQALALLYDRYSSFVYSIALRVLRDPALAEKILSDIFLEVWRSPKRFMQITGCLSPSMATVSYTHLDVYKRQWGTRGVAARPALENSRSHQTSSPIDRMSGRALLVWTIPGYSL